MGKKDNGVGSENNYNFKCSSFKNKCSRKERDSEEEEEYENDSEDQGHDNDYDEEEEEPGRTKRRKTEFCEEEVRSSVVLLYNPVVVSVFTVYLSLT